MDTKDISRLPKWAQEMITDLQRERETAIKALNDHLDSQTPSPFRIEDMVCTGEQTAPSKKVVFIQTYKMTVEFKGIRLDILTSDDSHQRQAGIELSWDRTNRMCEGIGLVPVSFNKVLIPAQEEKGIKLKV